MNDKVDLVGYLDSLTPRQRKRVVSSITKARRKRQNKNEQKKEEAPRTWSKEDIIGVLKSAKLRLGARDVKLAVGAYDRIREQDGCRWPTSRRIVKVFGTWDAALDEAGLRSFADISKDAKDQILGEIPNSASYFVSLFKAMKFQTPGDYQNAHKEDPHLVPSYKKVKQNFGSFKNAKKLAESQTISTQIVALAKLMATLNGRWPTRKTCRSCGINRALLERHFEGDKAELESFMRDLVKSIKKAEGSRQ